MIREYFKNQNTQNDTATKPPEKIVDIDGKQIWKVYITRGEARFNYTYTGTGNFSIKLLDENQDLLELVVNEIGDYVLDKTVKVPYAGLYYVQFEVSKGECNGSFK
jgi:hypothetical protein